MRGSKANIRIRRQKKHRAYREKSHSSFSPEQTSGFGLNGSSSLFRFSAHRSASPRRDFSPFRVPRFGLTATTHPIRSDTADEIQTIIINPPPQRGGYTCDFVKKRQICKPGSVPPESGSHHLSRTAVTRSLYLPTPRKTEREQHSARTGFPVYAAFHPVRFAQPAASPSRRWALTPPFHPYHVRFRTWRLFSVVLSVTCGFPRTPLPVRKYGALRCPDFPRACAIHARDGTTCRLVAKVLKKILRKFIRQLRTF